MDSVVFSEVSELKLQNKCVSLKLELNLIECHDEMGLDITETEVKHIHPSLLQEKSEAE